MHVVIFRLHGQMNIQTVYYGPFADFDTAYEFLCELPALGICPEGEEPGVKYINEMVAAESLLRV